MRSWYTDVMRKPRPKRIDWAELGSQVHDIISAAGGALILLFLAFVLSGARL